MFVMPFIYQLTHNAHHQLYVFAIVLRLTVLLFAVLLMESDPRVELVLFDHVCAYQLLVNITFCADISSFLCVVVNHHTATLNEPDVADVAIPKSQAQSCSIYQEFDHTKF